MKETQPAQPTEQHPLIQTLQQSLDSLQSGDIYEYTADSVDHYTDRLHELHFPGATDESPPLRRA